MRPLRGDLESLAAVSRTERAPVMAMSAVDLARELGELIAALDRRVPQVEQAGEAAIARDAAALRAKAMDRLAELTPHAVVARATDTGGFGKACG